MARYDIEKIDALIARARELKRNIQSGTKAAQNIKRQEDANFAFRDAERQAHEIHCIAVEMGMAAPEEWRYGDKAVGMKFGRELLEHRRRPDNR